MIWDKMAVSIMRSRLQQVVDKCAPLSLGEMRDCLDCVVYLESALAAFGLAEKLYEEKEKRK